MRVGRVPSGDATSSTCNAPGVGSVTLLPEIPPSAGHATPLILVPLNFSQGPD